MQVLNLGRLETPAEELRKLAGALAGMSLDERFQHVEALRIEYRDTLQKMRDEMKVLEPKGRAGDEKAAAKYDALLTQELALRDRGAALRTIHARVMQEVADARLAQRLNEQAAR